MHPKRISPPKSDRGAFGLRQIADQIRKRLDAGKPVRLLDSTALLVERGLNAAAALLEEDDRNLYQIETYDQRHNLIQVLGKLHDATAARAAWKVEVEKRDSETIVLTHRGRPVLQHEARLKQNERPAPTTTFGRMRALGMITADCVCQCGHAITINVLNMPATDPIEAFGSGMRCVDCGTQGLTVRMHLSEYYRVLDGREELG